MNEELEVRIGVVVRVLSGVIALLVFAHLAGQYARYFLGYHYLKGFVPLFDLDAELNFPAYFSLLLLAFASQLLAFIAVLAYKTGAPHVSKWLILSSGFLFMAFDEGFSVHERWTGWVQQEVGSSKLGIFHFAWVIPALVLIALLGVFFLRFLRDLPAATRWRFVLAAAFYLGGAIGMEMIEGWYVEARGLPTGIRDFNYSLMVVLEEALGEMGGLVLFIRALLLYCAHCHAHVRLSFRPPGGQADRMVRKP